MRGMTLLMPYAVYLAGATCACFALLDLIEALAAIGVGLGAR